MRHTFIEDTLIGRHRMVSGDDVIGKQNASLGFIQMELV